MLTIMQANLGVWSSVRYGGNFVLHVALWDPSIVHSREFRGGRFSEVTGTCIIW